MYEDIELQNAQRNKLEEVLNPKGLQVRERRSFVDRLRGLWYGTEEHKGGIRNLFHSRDYDKFIDGDGHTVELKGSVSYIDKYGRCVVEQHMEGGPENEDNVIKQVYESGSPTGKYAIVVERSIKGENGGPESKETAVYLDTALIDCVDANFSTDRDEAGRLSTHGAALVNYESYGPDYREFSMYEGGTGKTTVGGTDVEYDGKTTSERVNEKNDGHGRKETTTSKTTTYSRHYGEIVGYSEETSRWTSLPFSGGVDILKQAKEGVPGGDIAVHLKESHDEYGAGKSCVRGEFRGVCNKDGEVIGITTAVGKYGLTEEDLSAEHLMCPSVEDPYRANLVVAEVVNKENGSEIEGKPGIPDEVYESFANEYHVNCDKQLVTNEGYRLDQAVKAEKTAAEKNIKEFNEQMAKMFPQGQNGEMGENGNNGGRGGAGNKGIDGDYPFDFGGME